MSEKGKENKMKWKMISFGVWSCGPFTAVRVHHWNDEWQGWVREWVLSKDGKRIESFSLLKSAREYVRNN